jgi:hypothetical protein
MNDLEAEERRHRFKQMLQFAEQEADRDGPVPVDSVLAEIDEIIDAAEI